MKDQRIADLEGAYLGALSALEKHSVRGHLSTSSERNEPRLIMTRLSESLSGGITVIPNKTPFRRLSGLLRETSRGWRDPIS